MPSLEKARAPKEILELVARFEQQLEAYTSDQYNETQVRRAVAVGFIGAIVEGTYAYKPLSPALSPARPSRGESETIACALRSCAQN